MFNMSVGFEFEERYWDGGLLVAGLDEVGRGAFAGPLVCGGVVFPPGIWRVYGKSGVRIDDSKRLTRKSREVASLWIKKNALSWSVGEACVEEVNELGVKGALNLAFGRALEGLRVEVGHVLLDGNGRIEGYKGGLTSIIGGDGKAFSIAAASIIAKVHRDKILCDVGKMPKYSAYRWYKNMGYGTAEHLKALLKYGQTDYHRKQFVKTFLFNNSSAFRAR